MVKKVFIFIAIGLFIGTAFSQSINIPKLDSLFQILGEKNKFMGSVSIFQNGKQVYNRNVGYSFLLEDNKVLNNSSTKFQIGSITKMFTAAIIFQLIDAKKLTLETKLSNYFPEIPNSDKISIKILLGHKSGLFDFVNDTKDKNYLTKKRDKKDLIKLIITGKPHFKPNTSMAYCNSGYLLLSYIIEKITSQKYKDVVQERICNKINLLNTFSCAINDTNSHIATPYSFNGKWNEVKDFYFPNVQGVGDIVSTGSDLIIFNEALLAGKLFSKLNLENMKRVSGSQFCLGIMRIPFGQKIAYGHGGDSYGTHSIVASFEKDSLSIACTDNGEVIELNDISYAIAKICFKKNYEIPTFNTTELKTEDLDQYLGVYTSSELSLKITITKDNIILNAQAKGQSKFQLDAITKDKFEYKSAGIKLEFLTDKNQMILKQGGGKYKLTKK